MSDEVESLASVLGGSSAFHEPAKAVEAKPEMAEQPKPEPAPDARARDDSGKFAKTEPEKVVEAKADPKVEKPDEPVHVAAIMDERRKRQALERQLAELQQRLPREEPKPPPSVFEDEDGAISQRVEARLGPMQQAFVDQSVTLARLLHKDDWSDAEEGFIEAAEANPELFQRFRNATNPGEFAYQAGMYHREMAKYGGSVVAMRDAIRAEGATKLTEATARVSALEKEIADLKAAKVEADSVPKSLNNRASGAVNAETQTDPESTASIVRFGNKSG